MSNYGEYICAESVVPLSAKRAKLGAGTFTAIETAMKNPWSKGLVRGTHLSEHTELRVDMNNGITMCEKCHKEFHNNYGYTGNDDIQLDEFLSLKNAL